MIVGDAGSRRASPQVLDELLELTDDVEGREIVIDDSTPALNAAFPTAASVVVARVSAAQAAPIAMAVLREGHPDIGAAARVQTLTAFAGHASLTTANARLYAELESALARQLDLNRQKGDFVAAVSHELRTPLAVMLAATHTLRKLADRIPETKRIELLDASIEQGNRLQRLIDELLLVAAAEHEQSAPVCVETEIAPIVADIEDELRLRTGDRLDVRVGTGGRPRVRRRGPAATDPAEPGRQRVEVRARERDRVARHRRRRRRDLRGRRSRSGHSRGRPARVCSSSSSSSTSRRRGARAAPASASTSAASSRRSCRRR